MKSSGTYARIYAVIKRIPPGCVATYGQIADIARASGPRQVGYALNGLPDGHDVPWHRVINAKGEVSPRAKPGWVKLQQTLLEEEGVGFDDRGRVSLERFRWDSE